MKYLDERITINVSMGSPYPAKGMYKFYVYEYDSNASTEDDQIIFIGNYYYDRTSSLQTFDITNIVRSRKVTIPVSRYGNASVDANLIKRYKIKAEKGTGSSVTSSWSDVAMIYRYPNVNGSMTNGTTVYNHSLTATGIIKPALQSFNGSNVTYPSHYPLKATSKYKYIQSFIHSSDIQNIVLKYENPELSDYSIYRVANDPYGTTCIRPIISLIDFQYHEQELEAGDCDLYCTVSTQSTDIKKVAIFDNCYSRYYLQWQDRFGGWQSQAFRDNIQYSEDFSVTETQSYTNERKKSLISVQPKWKLSSGWIEEEYYPIYESIYVSPTVILYDSLNDVSYPVFVTGNYTEKKYKNEKKLLNLTLNLEHSIKQNIVY